MCLSRISWRVFNRLPFQVQFESPVGVYVQCHPTFRVCEDDQLRQDVINFTWQFCNAAMLRFTVPPVHGNSAVVVAASLVNADASTGPVLPAAVGHDLAEKVNLGVAAITEEVLVDDNGGATESEDEWFDAEDYP